MLNKTLQCVVYHWWRNQNLGITSLLETMNKTDTIDYKTILVAYG
jgi:hypothetical protein